MSITLETFRNLIRRAEEAGAGDWERMWKMNSYTCCAILENPTMMRYWEEWKGPPKLFDIHLYLDESMAEGEIILEVSRNHGGFEKTLTLSSSDGGASPTLHMARDYVHVINRVKVLEIRDGDPVAVEIVADYLEKAQFGTIVDRQPEG